MLYKEKSGFTLIEVVIGTALFLMLILAVSQGFVSVFKLVKISRVKTVATLLANEQFEGLRQLSYSDVGLIGGVPVGAWPRFQTFDRNGYTFYATTTIRNIDDPFDGTIGGSPNDLSPADYKLAELELWCDGCLLANPLTFSATFAPKNLETTSGNGALFIRAIDADGSAIPQAQVRVVNDSANPPIDITEETNNDGWLQLVDIPPGELAYQISVTKSGYSSVQTYPSNDPDNPEPTLPQATVLAGQATQLSLSIDQLSSVKISTRDTHCLPIAGISLGLRGTKTIGLNPVIYKYDESHVTDADGLKDIFNLEWDSYTLTNQDGDYDVAAISPINPVGLLPGANLNWDVFLTPKSSRSLLVSVYDDITGLPLNASTTLQISSTGIETSPTFNDSGCLVEGQTFFSNLPLDDYDLMVSLSGYELYEENNINLSTDWQMMSIGLPPL